MILQVMRCSCLVVEARYGWAACLSGSLSIRRPGVPHVWPLIRRSMVLLMPAVVDPFHVVTWLLWTVEQPGQALGLHQISFWIAALTARNSGSRWPHSLPMRA